MRSMDLSSDVCSSDLTARTYLTREVWEAVNTGWMTLVALLKRPVREDDLPDVLATIRRQNGQVRGALTGTMLRGDGFHFAQLGTFLARADNQIGRAPCRERVCR